MRAVKDTEGTQEPGRDEHGGGVRDLIDYER
jgi:hypothetical protein